MSNNVINEIKKLKSTIKPRPEWTTLSRELLLSQIKETATSEKVSLGVSGFWSIFSQTFRQSLFEPVVVMFLILGSFLLSSLTINAAFYSLPGDSLYPVKLALEKTHAAFVTGDEQKLELKIEYAAKRVAEIDKLVAQTNVDPETKKRNIEAAVNEFKNNVSDVNSHLAKLNQTIKLSDPLDKDHTVKMALSAGSKTEELVKTIDEKVSQLSADEKKDVSPIIAEAAKSAQETTISVQQLVQDANQSDGTVEGAATSTDATINASTTAPVETGSNSVSGSTTMQMVETDN